MIRHRRSSSGRTPRREVRGRLLLAVMLAATVGLLTASPTHAHHIPGATYVGTHYAGGSVTLTVSADGSGITSFSATNVPGFSCTITSFSTSFGAAPPITDHTFGFSTGGSTFGMQGSFPALQRVEGTFYAQGGCTSRGPDGTPNVPFSASTTASPAGSIECQTATQAVQSAQQAVNKATKNVRKARRKRQKASNPEAKKRLNKKLKRARRKMQAEAKKLAEAKKGLPEACG